MKNLRKTIAMLVALVVMVSNLGLAIEAYGVEVDIQLSEPNGKEYRTIKNLHLRESDSEESASIVEMPKGSYVRHMGTAESDWFKLEYKGQVGFAHRMDVTSKANYVKNYDDTPLTDPNGMEYRTIKKLSLREGNGEDYGSLMELPKGSYVKHIGTAENDWFKLEYKNKVGYIHRTDVTAKANYVKNYDDTPLTDSNGMEYRTIKRLPLRDGNGEDYSSLIELPKGSYVKHIGTAENDWFKLEYKNKVGYIHRTHVNSKSNYIKNHDDTPISKPNGMEYRTIRDLPLKEGNGEEYGSLMDLPKGSYVKHLGTTKNDWFKLEHKGKVGYIHRTDVTSKSNYKKNYEDMLVTGPNGMEYRTIKDLHLRKGNSDNHASLSLMPKGSYVKHLGTTANDWFKLEYKGQVGFAHRMDVTSKANYVKNYDDTPLTPSNGMEYRTIKELTLRGGNGEEYDSLMVIEKGAYVKHLGTADNDWFKLEHEGKVGYIHRTEVTSSDRYVRIYDDATVTGPNGMEYRAIKELPLREGNGREYGTFTVMPQGAYVKHLGTTANDWFKLEYKDRVGYVDRTEVTSQENYENNYILKPSNSNVYYYTTQYEDTLSQALDKQEGRNTKFVNGNPNVKATRGDVEKYLNPDRFLQFHPKNEKQGVVTGSTLNIRTGPGGNYSKIGATSKGRTHKILSESNNWYQIEFNGKTGWVSSAYIDEVGNKLASIEIKANSSDIRTEPNANSRKRATVSKGEVYVILDKINGWYKVNVGNNINSNLGWVSGKDVKYTNDVPRDMYQFMVLSGSMGINSSQMNEELKGKGILDGKGGAFIEGAKKYNVNELYLVAHSILETGHGTSELSNGVLVDEVDGKPVEPKKVYNMYGINAYNQTAVKSGSERAYKEGWFTPEKAIIEGADWISRGYINNPLYKQDTLYKMKYNSGGPTWHQYATDVAWAYKQIKQIDNVMDYYKRMSGAELRFDIPSYK